MASEPWCDGNVGMTGISYFSVVQKRVAVLNPPHLKAIFAPRSVAVIGASAKQHSLGRAVFANLLFAGYNGCVYPVNSKAKNVLGVRAYPNVMDVPDDVDLAVGQLDRDAPAYALPATRHNRLSLS